MTNITHHPHCNRSCSPAGHMYSIPEREHAHLAIMTPRCALCRARDQQMALQPRRS